MSLAKIPITIAVSWAVWVALTSPSHQEKKEEGEKYSHIARENMVRRIAVSAPLVCKVLYALGALSEILVILAAQWPDTPPFQCVTPLLLRSGSAERIYLSHGAAFTGLIAVCGGLSRLRCYAEMGKMFTFEMVIRDDHRLITTGPYSYVRHPSYTGLIAVITSAIAYLSCEGSYIHQSSNPVKAMATLWSIWMLIVMVMLILRIPHEDEGMHKQFGEKWERWRENVPWRLIPKIY